MAFPEITQKWSHVTLFFFSFFPKRHGAHDAFDPVRWVVFLKQGTHHCPANERNISQSHARQEWAGSGCSRQRPLLQPSIIRDKKRPKGGARIQDTDPGWHTRRQLSTFFYPNIATPQRLQCHCLLSAWWMNEWIKIVNEKILFALLIYRTPAPASPVSADKHGLV